jgi:hypothetical protein
VTSGVVEARRHKMATANRLTVLQKTKEEKGVLFGSFSSDLTKQKKLRSGSDQAC